MKTNKKVIGCFLAVFMLLAVSFVSAAGTYTVKSSGNKDTIEPEYQPSSTGGGRLVIVDSFDSPGLRPRGLTWDGTYLWNADYGTDKIYKLHVGTYNLWVKKSFDSPQQIPRGLAWDGNYLWNADYWEEKIYKIDPSDGSVVYSFDSPKYGPTGLAWDGSYLWNADRIEDKIYKIDPSDGSVVYSFSSPGSSPEGLAWDGNYLWNADSDTDKIYKIDVTDEPPTAQYIWEDADGDGPGTVINFDASESTDDNGIVSYDWDWTSDGDYDDSYTTPYCSHDYGDTDLHDCTLKVTDTIGQTGTVTITVWADVGGGGNHPPVTPDRPDGPTNGQPGESYTYSTSTTDPDDDNVYYWFDWGDGSNSGWIGPYSSGETGSASHSWSEEGEYNVKAKAKDTYDEESSYSPSLEVTIGEEILLTEGFEDEVMPPSRWTVDNKNTQRPWSIAYIEEDPEFVHSGNYGASIGWDENNPSDNWLTSPDIDLSDCPKVKLTFWANSSTKYPDATMELHIMGDGFDDVIWDMIEDENWPKWQFREVTLDLSSYIGETVKIAWRYVGINGDGFALDDITVTDPDGGGGWSYQQQSQQQQSLQGSQASSSTSSLSQQSMQNMGNLIYCGLHNNIR